MASASKSQFGGLAYGFNSRPVITSTITINGVTQIYFRRLAGGCLYDIIAGRGAASRVQHVVRDWLNDGITNRDHCILYSYGYFAGAPALRSIRMSGRSL